MSKNLPSRELTYPYISHQWERKLIFPTAFWMGYVSSQEGILKARFSIPFCWVSSLHWRRESSFCLCQRSPEPPFNQITPSWWWYFWRNQLRPIEMDERREQGWLSLSLGKKFMKIFARQVHEFQVFEVCWRNFCFLGEERWFSWPFRWIFVKLAKGPKNWCGKMTSSNLLTWSVFVGASRVPTQ